MRVLLPHFEAAIDWSSLKSEDTTQITRIGAERTSDLLFTLQLQGAGRVIVAILLEIQSSNDKRMPLRILEQNALIWRRAYQEPDRFMSNEKLLPIIGIVFSNVQGGWTSPTQMHDLVQLPQDPELLKCIPQVEYHVFDLVRWELNDPRLSAFLRCLAAIERAEGDALRDAIQRMSVYFRSQPENRDLFDPILMLFAGMAKSGRLPPDAVDCLKDDISASEESHMSFAENMDNWIFKTRQEGRQEGQRIANKNAARRALELRFGAAGEAYWTEHFAALDIAPWEAILEAAIVGDSLAKIDALRSQPSF